MGQQHIQTEHTTIQKCSLALWDQQLLFDLSWTLYLPLALNHAVDSSAAWHVPL